MVKYFFYCSIVGIHTYLGQIKWYAEALKVMDVEHDSLLANYIDDVHGMKQANCKIFP